MMEKLKTWLKSRTSSGEQPLPVNIQKTGSHAISRPKKPLQVKSQRDESAQERKSDVDKNALIRNKYVREDTGTHETLTILDDSLLDSGEETGIDPYNTGGFDRSKNWNNRFRK